MGNVAGRQEKRLERRIAAYRADMANPNIEHKQGRKKPGSRKR